MIHAGYEGIAIIAEKKYTTREAYYIVCILASFHFIV